MGNFIVDSYLVAALAFLINLISVILAIYKLGRAVEKFENIGTQQANEIKDLKIEVITIAKLVTETSVQNNRLDAAEARLERQEQLIDDLRRGEGRILPISISAYEAPKPR